MEMNKDIIQTPFSLEINQNDYETSKCPEINKNEFSHQLENQNVVTNDKLPLIKVKVFETHQVNLLNKNAMYKSILNKSKEPTLIKVKKLIPIHPNVLDCKQKSNLSQVKEPKVLPILKNCSISLKKLPKIITDGLNSNEESLTNKSAQVTTVEAPDKIYKVVSINNKIMLVEQNENELDLDSVTSNSSLDEDYDPNKDPNISDVDSDITNVRQQKKLYNKQIMRGKRKIQDKQEKCNKQKIQDTQKDVNETQTMNEPFDKSKFISKKPLPTHYKSNNPFTSNRDYVPSIAQNTKHYENLFPGVYVAQNKTNKNQGTPRINIHKRKSSQFTRVIEDFVNQFSDIMNYEWYNDQDILIYGKQGTAMVLLHEAKYNTMINAVDEKELIETDFKKHKKEKYELEEEYNSVKNKLIQVQKELENVNQKLNKLESDYHLLNDKKYLPLKSFCDKILPELGVLRLLKDNLYKQFSPAQMNLITNQKKDKVPWSEEDIRKIMFLKSNISTTAYKFLKNQMKFPLPKLELVVKWMTERNIFARNNKKTKTVKYSLDTCKRKVSKEDIQYYPVVNITNKQIQDGTISVNEESTKQYETEQAIEMIIQQPQMEVDVSDQQLATPVYSDGDICLSYVDDSNVNEEYYIIDESYVNNDGTGEIYVQNGDDVNVNNDNINSEVVEDVVHYADTENYVEYSNDINDTNVLYTDVENQTEQENSSCITQDNVNNETIKGDMHETNEENNAIVYNMSLGKYSKWDLNKLQDFRQKRNRLSQKYFWSRTCQLCLRQFESTDELKQHVPLHYSNMYVTPYINAEKPYVCAFCQEQLPHKFALLRHHIEHLNITEFRCWHPGCTYVSKKKGGVVTHAESHKPRRHVCPTCTARFKDRKALREHFARKHSQRGKYTCSLCGGLYYSEFTYYLHMRSHNKPPRYKCTIDGCTESYYSRRALTRHKVARHTGLTIYQCPHCPIATFHTNHMFLRHMYRHDNERMSKCPKCDKIFDTYTEYYYHIKTEPHNRRLTRHTCLCNQIFDYKKDLIKHQRECELSDTPNRRRSNLWRLRQQVKITKDNNIDQSNEEQNVIITSQKIWRNTNCYGKNYKQNVINHNLSAQERSRENTVLEQTVTTIEPRKQQENVVEKKTLKLYPVSEEQQKMLEEMTRLKKLIPVPGENKIGKFKQVQQVNIKNLKDLHITSCDNNNVYRLQTTPLSDKNESNELIPDEKVIVEDSCQRTLAILRENNQRNTTDHAVTSQEVTHEANPPDNIVVTEEPQRPKLITLSKKLRKISVGEFNKLMANSPSNFIQNTQIKHNVKVENVNHIKIKVDDNIPRSTQVVQTPEYSQHIESWQDEQQQQDIPDVIGNQPDMPNID